jgi:ankyrin repeat protein
VNKGEPLHWAAAMGHPAVVKELLKSRVDVNAVKNIQGFRVSHDTRPYDLEFSPLYLASLCGHKSVVKPLCEDTKGH